MVLENKFSKDGFLEAYNNFHQYAIAYLSKNYLDELRQVNKGHKRIRFDQLTYNIHITNSVISLKTSFFMLL